MLKLKSRFGNGDEQIAILDFESIFSHIVSKSFIEIAVVFGFESINEMDADVNFGTLLLGLIEMDAR